MAGSSTRRLAADVAAALRTYHEQAAELDAAVARHAGIGMTDLRCLSLIEHHDGRMTAGALSELSGLTTGAITGVINRLERAGLARRAADPDDRRRVIVEIDASSRERCREVFTPLVAAQRRAAEGYDADALTLLQDFLDNAAERAAEAAAALRDDQVSGTHT